MKSWKVLTTSATCLFLIVNVALAFMSKADSDFEPFWKQVQTAIKNKDKDAFINLTENKIYYLDPMMDDYVELKDKAKVFDDKTMKMIFSFTTEFLKTDAITVMNKELNGNGGFKNVLKKKFKNKIVYRCSVGTNTSGLDMWFAKSNNQYKIIAFSIDEGE